MDEFLKKVSLFFVAWWKNFAGSFSVSVIFLSLLNMYIVAQYRPERKGVSPLLPSIEGLPYALIFQLVCLLIILCFFSVLLRSEIFIIKMRYLYRNLLLIFLGVSTTLLFIIKFNWVPETENWRIISGLLLVIVILTICFIVENKLKTKKYNELLANFKESRKKTLQDGRIKIRANGI